MLVPREYAYHKRIYAANVVAHFNPHRTARELQNWIFREDPDATITSIEIVEIKQPEAFDVTVRYLRSDWAENRVRDIMSDLTPEPFKLPDDGDGEDAR